MMVPMNVVDALEWCQSVRIKIINDPHHPRVVVTYIDDMIKFIEQIHLRSIESDLILSSDEYKFLLEWDKR